MSLFGQYAGMVCLGACLMASAAWAQPTNTSAAPTSPVVVGKNSATAPADIKALVNKFQTEREAYLSQQKALEAKLQNATTPAERAAIRKALQANRDEFLADLKDYRQDLKQEIDVLKDKLNNTELDRLIEEVKQGAAPHHHHKL